MIFDMVGDTDVTFKHSPKTPKGHSFHFKRAKTNLMDNYSTLGKQQLGKRKFFSDFFVPNNALCIRAFCFCVGIAQEKCHCYQGEDTARRGVNCQNRIPTATWLTIQLKLIFHELNLTPTRCLEVEHPEQ